MLSQEFDSLHGIMFTYDDVILSYNKIKNNVVIDDNECHNYIGHKDEDGYGRRKIKNKRIGVHRMVAVIHAGRLLETHELACHTCDNPGCINPDHIYVGSAQSNSIDMVNRRRSTRGEKSARSKISNNDAIEIRKRYADGDRLTDIGEDFNLAKSTVSYIINNKTYRDYDA